MSEEFVLRAVKPLYGIPEAGLYWFETYQGHHVNRLHMQVCEADECLLFRKGKSADNDTTVLSERDIPTVVILQVDDSLGTADAEFLKDEEREVQVYKCKPRTIISSGTTVNFNGMEITRTKNGEYMTGQPRLCDCTVPNDVTNLVSLRAKLQYLAGVTRPDIAGMIHLMAKQVKEPTKEVYKSMSDVIHYCQKTKTQGLKYVRLDPNSLRLILFTDSSFANAENFASQLGFVLVLADGNGNSNIVHFGSVRCRRVTRSVMASELLALVYGFDCSFVVKHSLDNILPTKIPLDVFIDSRTVFNTIAKRSGTLEKRLSIDAYALRQSHFIGEIRKIGWIASKENPADGLTRSQIPNENHALIQLMRSNKLNFTENGSSSTKSIAN